MAHYRKPDAVAFEVLDGETVALHLGTSVYYRLNRTGTCTWEVLVDGGDAVQAAQAVSERFAVDEEAAHRDVDALIDQLVEAGLLEPR